MNLTQIIYASRPFEFDQAALNGILSQSRRCNLRDDITEALICRSDLHLQLLEGPNESISATYARIVRDDRHLEVIRLSYETVTERIFPGWAMRDDPARSWMWTKVEVDQGVVANATRQQVLEIFQRVAAEPV